MSEGNRRILQVLANTNRRDFLIAAFGAIASCCGLRILGGCSLLKQPAETFIAGVGSYSADIASVIRSGFRELHVDESEIRGKRVLLKPNLVEPHQSANHINTHPLVVRGAIEAFRNLGAAEVLVAEGPGHYRDTYLVLEESGLIDVLRDDRIPFTDLNYDGWYTVPNAGSSTRLKTLTLPATLKKVDWIVSMPKMKTHHWAGVTLSMKNLFGVMPGMFYGWPKNVLHVQGIEKSILDIHATVKPQFAIVDGIVGMEGDGPIMGTPKQAGVLVMGRSLPSVDATSCRIMGINPHKVPHLANADRFGPIRESDILQCGETIRSVRTRFQLLSKIKAQRPLIN
jgi:uncharacterized protein (DUF362 family)